MANAFKCDRCGKLVEGNCEFGVVTGELSKKDFVGVPEIKEYCDDCKEAFEKFEQGQMNLSGVRP